MQDTTVKMNVTENQDPEKALSKVVILSDLIITAQQKSDEGFYTQTAAVA